MSGYRRCTWAMAALAVGWLAVSCAVGPSYQRPDLAVPTTFKSATTQDAGAPRLGRDWWRLFGDPQLDALEGAALQANQDLRAAVARVAQARAAAAIVGSQFYPVVTLDPSATRQRRPALSTAGTRGAVTSTNITIPFDLNYEVDIWGRVRRSVEAAGALTQASIVNVEVVRQTVAADVAQNYFTLRALDDQDRILDSNVELYAEQLKLVQTQFTAGLVGRTDVLQAQTLLESTQAQEIEIRRQRADVEHALAILLGRPPSELTLALHPLDLAAPVVPAGLPADLLRRRPDVAEAEQNLIAANAQIGVATANFYPVVRLTGAAGFESVDVQHALDWESRIWSIGPSVTIPVFEGGQLTASLAQARARYDELQANYRGAVLGAFRDVEDALTDLHHRTDEADAQARAVSSAREYLRLAQLQYRQGLVNYLLVIDAERTVLANELAASQILNARLVSSVLLIKALGGGWDAQALPAPADASEQSHNLALPSGQPGSH